MEEVLEMLDSITQNVIEEYESSNTEYDANLKKEAEAIRKGRVKNEQVLFYSILPITFTL